MNRIIFFLPVILFGCLPVSPSHHCETTIVYHDHNPLHKLQYDTLTFVNLTDVLPRRPSYSIFEILLNDRKWIRDYIYEVKESSNDSIKVVGYINLESDTLLSRNKIDAMYEVHLFIQFPNKALPWLGWWKINKELNTVEEIPERVDMVLIQSLYVD